MILAYLPLRLILPYVPLLLILPYLPLRLLLPTWKGWGLEGTLPYPNFTVPTFKDDFTLPAFKAAFIVPPFSLILPYMEGYRGLGFWDYGFRDRVKQDKREVG
jgi:hypothetical protein